MSSNNDGNDLWFLDKARIVLDSLDSETYPETTEYLGYIISDDLFDQDTYEVATTLCQCDFNVQWNNELIDFITELYMYGIDHGDERSMNDLGAHYYDGNRGFEQSFEKAVKYYKLAAANGDRQAQENLGYCYYYGRDCEVDYEKAFNYFALGAFDGHLISLYKIGDMYYNGYYVEKNYYEAFIIYMHCLEIMTEEAALRVAGPIYLRLGKMFLYGNGTEKDLVEALKCFKNAEEYLTIMVENGDFMYKKSLQGAIDLQKKVHEEMERDIKGE